MCLLRKDPRILHRCAAFLYLRFGFDFLNVSQGKPDAPAQMVRGELTCLPPATNRDGRDLPARGEFVGGEKLSGFNVAVFHGDA